MKDERFIIQGPLVEEEVRYWSNEMMDWVDMDSATRFPPEVLYLPLPAEGVAVLELEDNGKVKKCYVRGQTTPPWVGGLTSDL